MAARAGRSNQTKRYRLAAAAHNLARIMRLLFGIGKPRALQDLASLVWLMHLAITAFWRVLTTAVCRLSFDGGRFITSAAH